MYIFGFLDFDYQILFFFSALGAFNGLFLSLYFAFFIKNRNRATYFLAALLFVISVRVTKSVFLTFYPGTSSTFVSVGLTACFLIGPFLYLYTRIATRPNNAYKWTWLVHIIPVIIFMITISILFPYQEYYELWWRNPPRVFGILLLSQWTIYVIATIYQARHSFKKMFSKTEKITTLDFWIINIVIGGFLIWLAYNTTQYTSYIVGALSFSFTFYITLVIWFFKRRKSAQFFYEPVKYANKKISDNEAAEIETKLQDVFNETELYKNPQLKLKDVAAQIGENPHILSEYLNNNLGKSFSFFINEYRVQAATQMLQSNHHLTIEAIGNDCGFKSNSSFYSAFKKYNGMTPAQFKKALI